MCHSLHSACTYIARNETAASSNRPVHVAVHTKKKNGLTCHSVALFEQEDSVYYFNTVTKESSWDRPAGFVTVATKNQPSQVRLQACKLSPLSPCRPPS